MGIFMTDAERYEVWMRRCIEIAKIAKRRGESPVGAVIVRDGQIVAEGIEGVGTHHDITFHAEIEAVRNATEKLDTFDLSDCILVTTHEPCIMCSYIIRHHRIPLIVVGITTGEIGGYSSALPVLLDKTISRWSAPPEIIDGVLEQDCKAI